MKNMIIIIIFMCLVGTAIAGTAIHMTDDGYPQSDKQMDSISNSGLTILNIDSNGFRQIDSNTDFQGVDFIIYVSDGYLVICSDVDIELVNGPYRDPHTFIIFWYRSDVKIIYYLPEVFFDDYPYITLPDFPLIPFPQYDYFIPITWPSDDNIKIGRSEKTQIIPIEIVQIPPPETIQIPPFKTIQIDPIHDIYEPNPIVWKVPDYHWIKPLSE
jgi:hypothetical protein